MSKALFFCVGILTSCVVYTQYAVQSLMQMGISIPAATGSLNKVYNGQAIHFGNHINIEAGSGPLKWGIGAYAGQLTSLGTKDGYKKEAIALATKFGLPSSQISFNESLFRSAHFLLGPVAAYHMKTWDINVWAKGGYSLNEPSRFAATFSENGANNQNILVTKAGENKNGIAYNFGGGIHYKVTSAAGIQFAANYFKAPTDQVGYSYDREKGKSPLFFTSANSFIQASLGLVMNINGGGKNKERASSSKNTSRASQSAFTSSAYEQGRKIKRVSDEDSRDTSVLLLVPKYMEIHAAAKATDAPLSSSSMQSNNRYLTGFAYSGGDGTSLAQCSGISKGKPLSGAPVDLKNTSTGKSYTARTNPDGSFSFPDIDPGQYVTKINNQEGKLLIRDEHASDYKVVEQELCGGAVSKNIIYLDGKMYVEVITAHEAGSGLATGKRQHKPFMRVIDVDFDINYSNTIMGDDDKLYAEVITAREAGSGMATGKSMGAKKGYDHYMSLNSTAIFTPRDPSTGLPTGRIAIGDIDGDGASDDVVSPRDLASGQASGKRMHKPMVVTMIDANGDEQQYEVTSPRDLASGQASGRRMHKPYIRVSDEDGVEQAYEIISPRDLASGHASGKIERNPLYSDPGTAGYNPLFGGKATSGENPLFEGSDRSGDNPLFEGKNNDAVKDNPLYKGQLVIRSANGAVFLANFPLLLSVGKELSNDGSVKKLDLGSGNVQKASINTTRSNIKKVKSVSCSNGSCAIEAAVEMDGRDYDATVVFEVKKSKHDTAKNSVNNVR